MTFSFARRSLLAALAASSLPLTPFAASSQELNLYTYREPALIKPLLDEFTKEHRHQGQHGVRRERARGAPARRGAEQPGGRAAHGRYRPPAAGQGLRRHPAGEIRCAREGDSRRLPRPRRALVRRLAPRPGRLCGEGPGRAGHDHLRGARRPQVEGQALHALGPASLQHRALRRSGRQEGRGQGRGMAEGRQGKSRQEALGRRPRTGEGHPRRRLRHRARQHLLCRPDAQRHQRAAPVGRRRSR